MIDDGRGSELLGSENIDFIHEHIFGQRKPSLRPPDSPRRLSKYISIFCAKKLCFKQLHFIT